MEKSGWMTIAIIMIIIFLGENVLLYYSYKSLMKEENLNKQCVYEYCKEYEQAFYQEGVCTCYGRDTLGYLIPRDYKVMN